MVAQVARVGTGCAGAAAAAGAAADDALLLTLRVIDLTIPIGCMPLPLLDVLEGLYETAGELTENVPSTR